MNRKRKQSKTDFKRKKPIYVKPKVNRREKEQPSTADKVKVHPAAIALLTDATWEFALAQLWNNYVFNVIETELCKIYIREFYESIPAEKFSAKAAKYFSGYCERILLAKKYVSRYPSRYIPHPCIWLNKRNPKGFAGTKTWYEENLKRASQQKTYLVIPITRLLPNFQFTA